MFHLERSFVETAESEMHWLETAWADGGQTADHGRTQLALSAIKASAGTVSARGVALAADRCEQVLVCGAEDMLRPLVMLQRLIGQYASGLREVDTAGEAVAAQSPENLTDTASEISSEQESAAQVLSSVIKYAPANDQTALQKLMRVSGFEKDIGIPAQVKKTLALESVMTPVTNAVLSCAHRQAKSVSVSYAVDDALVSQQHAESIQTALIDICTVLVERGLQTPQVRVQSGQVRTGQIAISALETPAGVRVSVSDNGVALPASRFAHIEAVTVSEGGRSGTEISVCIQDPEMPIIEIPNLQDSFDTDLAEAFA